MALQRDTHYPGRYNTGDSAHPQGAFKNRTTPTSQDGSYLEEQWLNDWDGFFGSLLDKAGLTADGNVDAVGASQYFTALQDVISRGDYVTAGGTANAITLTHTTPVTSYKDGQVFRFKASAANTGATTINVDGLGAVTLYGSAGLACQGGEIAANGYAIAIYSSTLSACVLIGCAGGNLQVKDSTQSHHGVALGQIKNTAPLRASQGIAAGTAAGVVSAKSVSFTAPSNGYVIGMSISLCSIQTYTYSNKLTINSTDLVSDNTTSPMTQISPLYVTAGTTVTVTGTITPNTGAVSSAISHTVLSIFIPTP